MRSLDLYLGKVSSELQYYQIEARDLYEKIRSEISGLVCGNLPIHRYNELALGMFEATVEAAFVCHRGLRLDERRYNISMAATYLLGADYDDIMQDGIADISRKILMILPKVDLEYRCAWQMLASLNLVVGIDSRDLIPLPEEPPLEEFVYDQDEIGILGRDPEDPE